MADRNANPTDGRGDTLRPSPFHPTEWERLTEALGLSPQQAKIVELILRGAGDKQIAAALGLSKHTVRTYLNRIFSRLGVSDRLELVIHVFVSTRSDVERARCPSEE